MCSILSSAFRHTVGMKWRNPDITYFAKTNFRDIRKTFGIRQSDRAFSALIIGKTGTGKSNLMLSKIVQDLKHNRGLCVFDIHNDLIPVILKHVPDYRKKDIVYVNVPDPNLKLGYNPLRKVSYEKRSLVASSLLESLQKLFSSSWGARLENSLRHILLTLLDQERANVRDILRIIQDEEYRTKCIAKVVNPDIKRFWFKEFPKYSKHDLLPIQNKISALLAHPAIKRVLTENKGNISFREIMDNEKILLVNLNKGALGTDISYLLGSLFLSSLTNAGFSRSDMDHGKKPFYIYADEFSQYTSPSIVSMLSELRKFKVYMVMALQYLNSLTTEIRDSVFGNVGSIICFRVSARDADYMLKELYLYDSDIEFGDFVNLPNYHVWVKLMINKAPSQTFSAITLPYTDFI